jgi:hypothetical protein
MRDSDPAVAWLLSSTDPSVRYLTLVDVVGASPRSRAAREARQQIPSGPRVRALLRGQRRDGSFGVHPYTKWTGAFWRLIALVELAIPSRHRGARTVAEQVLGWLGSEQHRKSIRTIDGRVRQHTAQEGYALAAGCRLGMAGDRRIRTLVDSLLTAQWPDGGWNCDGTPEAGHSSFHETFPPLWGLAEYAGTTGHGPAREAAERAAEFLLDHRLFRSHRTGRIDERWLKLRYPPYWHYDVLQGLLAVGRLGKLRDPRAEEALDVVASKRRTDCCWHAEGYHWKPPGASGSNVEVVDWGRRGPNEMITLNAVRVLRQAGRL